MIGGQRSYYCRIEFIYTCHRIQTNLDVETPVLGFHVARFLSEVTGRWLRPIQSTYMPRPRQITRIVCLILAARSSN